MNKRDRKLLKYVYLYLYVDICLYISISIYTYTQIHTYIHIFVYLYIVYICLYIYMYTPSLVLYTVIHSCTSVTDLKENIRSFYQCEKLKSSQTNRTWTFLLPIQPFSTLHSDYLLALLRAAAASQSSGSTMFPNCHLRLNLCLHFLFFDAGFFSRPQPYQRRGRCALLFTEGLVSEMHRRTQTQSCPQFNSEFRGSRCT